MAESVDIQEVLSRSTSEVSLEDLSRKGFRQVRVLSHAAIQRQISEAVDRAIEERDQELGKEEREEIIAESHRRFQELAREFEKEHQRVAALERDNQALREELAVLESRLKAHLTVEAERDQARQAIERCEAESAKLRQRLVDKEGELGELRTRLEEAPAAAAREREELERLERKLIEREKNHAQLEGELRAKNEEIQRLMRASDFMAEKVLGRLSERLGAMSHMGDGPADYREIKNALAGISTNLAKLAWGRAMVKKGEELDEAVLIDFAQRLGQVDVEANKVEVKQAKASGVRGSLAKLKEMQKRSDG